MFILNVAFGPIAWILAFNTKENAEKAVATLNGAMAPAMTSQFGTASPIAIVTDDFGQVVSCKEAPTAILFEDINQSRLLHIEYSLHRARIQFDVQKRAEADAGMRGSRGPAIVSPFAPNGGMGR